MKSMMKTHLVCVELEFSSQNSAGDVVHKIGSAH